MKHSTRDKTGYCGGSGSERRESRMIQGIHDDPIPQETDPGSGLLIGPQLANPGPARVPERMVLEGRYARFDPLDPALHRDDLYAASTTPDRTASFRYLSDPPPDSLGTFDTWLAGEAASVDPLFFAVTDRATERVEGWQTLMRITPSH